MTTVHIKATREYDVFIERGLIKSVGEYAARFVKPMKAVLIAGTNAYSYYGETVEKSLKDAGFTVLTFVHETGEGAKSIETYGKIMNFLCDNRVSRSDIVLALGGGVTGDLAGFVAATYLRGVKYIQIPTTLLAAVDSSVGGKTAINLNSGKNQAGCFYQPCAVLCDPDTLKTLAPEDYRCGVAETIKYGVLGDAEFFAFLEKNDIHDVEEEVIAHCVKMKRDIVLNDEFDRGERQKLNLGHSIGHACEKCSGFKLHHGDAVATGMAIIMRAAVKKGLCPESEYERVVNLLKRYNLPTSTDYSAEELFLGAKADKKIENGKIHLIVPRKAGECDMVPVDIDGIKEWIIQGEPNG